MTVYDELPPGEVFVSEKHVIIGGLTNKRLKVTVNPKFNFIVAYAEGTNLWHQWVLIELLQNGGKFP